MAKSTQREDVKRLAKWLDFAQADEKTIRHEGSFWRAELGVVRGWHQPADSRTFDIAGLQSEALHIIRAVVEGRRCVVELSLRRQVWRDKRIAPGLLLSTSSDHMRDLLLYQLLVMLERVNVDRLQIAECGDPKCGRLFVRTTGKKFCSTKCQARLWMRDERAGKHD